MDVDATTGKGKGKGGKSKGKSKGSKDKEKRNSKGKDTEKEHRQKDCWSRHGKPVSSVEADAAEPQDVDPPSDQTPVPAAALTRFSPPGLPDDHWSKSWIMTLSKSSLIPSTARVRLDRNPGGQWSGRTRVQRTSLSWSADSTGQPSCLDDSRRNKSGDRLRETSASEN